MFKKFTIRLLIFYILRLKQVQSQEWSYYNASTWSLDYPQCNGSSQSPINIITCEVRCKYEKLIFLDYDKPFRTPLTMRNNGRTASVPLDVTTSGQRARVITTDGTYNAMEMHFHWPCEHRVNGWSCDVEVHFLHQNDKYNSTEEAMLYKDGFIVLAGMLIKSDASNQHLTLNDLNPVFDQMQNIRDYNTTTTLANNYTLSYQFGSADTTRFFSYDGSFTTPPCTENVKFYIFQEVKVIPAYQIDKLYQLRDIDSNQLVFTNRPVQDTNGRVVNCNCKK